MLHSNFQTAHDEQKSMQAVSYQEKFICIDNIGQVNAPHITTCLDEENDNYHYVIVVLQGTLDITVNGNRLALHANNYLSITPFTHIAIGASAAKIFMLAVQHHIMSDIFESIDFHVALSEQWYVYHHFHLTVRETDVLLNDYLRLKHEMQRQNYTLQEYAIRAGMAILISHICSISEATQKSKETKLTRQETLFYQFLDLLDQQYLEHRSLKHYATLLHTTPKHLSQITMEMARRNASKVIEEYVV